MRKMVLTIEEIERRLDTLCDSPDSPLRYFSFLENGKVQLEFDLRVPGIPLVRKCLSVSTVRKQLRTLSKK